MIRKTLTILSLIGLLLSVGLWLVSCSEGWSHTHFYIGQDGEEIGITFICADGRIGWDDPGDMSDSVLSPDHGVVLWPSTMILAGSFLFSVFHKFCERVVRSIMRGTMRTARRIGTDLGRATDKFRKPLTIISLTGLLLSVGLWGASYWNFILVPTASGPMIHLTQGSLQTHWSNVPSETIPSGGSMPVGQITISDSSFKTVGGQVTSFTVSGITFGTGWACNGFRGLTTQWKASVDRTWMPVTCSVILPLWIPSAVFAAASPSVFFVGGRYRRRRLGLCAKCGYNLRGLTEPRCPECNTSFDERLLKKDA